MFAFLEQREQLCSFLLFFFAIVTDERGCDVQVSAEIFSVASVFAGDNVNGRQCFDGSMAEVA